MSFYNQFLFGELSDPSGDSDELVQALEAAEYPLVDRVLGARFWNGKRPYDDPLHQVFLRSAGFAYIARALSIARLLQSTGYLETSTLPSVLSRFEHDRRRGYLLVPSGPDDLPIDGYWRPDLEWAHNQPFHTMFTGATGLAAKVRHTKSASRVLLQIDLPTGKSLVQQYDPTTDYQQAMGTRKGTDTFNGKYFSLVVCAWEAFMTMKPSDFLGA